MTFRHSVSAAALALMCLFAVTGCGGDAGAHPPGLRVGLASDPLGGPGDATYTKGIQAGVDKVRAEKPGRIAEFRELTSRNGETADDKYDRLIILCESGYDPVIVSGWGYVGPDPADGPLARAAKACPKTRFAMLDNATVSAPNVADLAFAGQQGAFLAGVAAATMSHKGQVAFLGGCEIPLVRADEAGYRAGVQAVNPDVSVQSSYLSSPKQKCSGFYDAFDGKRITDTFYRDGIDVVFTVAGGGDIGVLESTALHNGMAIGSYNDEYKTADISVRDVVVTSIVKHADIVVADFLGKLIQGHFSAGVTTYGLDTKAITYATSGGKIDKLTGRLDDYRKKIINGSIVVPDTV